MAKPKGKKSTKTPKKSTSPKRATPKRTAAPAAPAVVRPNIVVNVPPQPAEHNWLVYALLVLMIVIVAIGAYGWGRILSPAPIAPATASGPANPPYITTNPSYPTESRFGPSGQPLGIYTDRGPGGYTGPDVIRKVLANLADYNAVVHAWPNNNGGWTIETAKDQVGEASKPCCGKLLRWNLGIGGTVHYWGKFAPPQSGTCYSVSTNVDPNSGLANWQVSCQPGQQAYASQSDGITWYPPQ